MATKEVIAAAKDTALATIDKAKADISAALGLESAPFGEYWKDPAYQEMRRYEDIAAWLNGFSAQITHPLAAEVTKLEIARVRLVSDWAEGIRTELQALLESIEINLATAEAQANNPYTLSPGEVELFTVDQLKKLAGLRGIDLGDLTRKADIIIAIFGGVLPPSE